MNNNFNLIHVTRRLGLLALVLALGCEGPAGKDGADGLDGMDGVDGRDGENGAKGADGKTGPNGSDGEDALNSVKGANGKNGTDGADGADGADGRDGRDGRDGTTGVGGGNPSAPVIGEPIVVRVSATGHDRFYGVTYDALGNIYAVGQVTSSTEATADIATVIAKFKGNGELDTSFGAGGFVSRNVAVGTNGELFRNIVVQTTGKVVAVGTVEHVGAADARDRDVALLRFNPDGTKDTTFGSDGILTLDLSDGVVNGTAFSADSAWGLDRYPDDRLVVSGGRVRDGGTDTDFVLVRLNADGTPDTTFGTDGLFSLDLEVNSASNNASPRNLTILPGTDGIIGGGYQPYPGGDTSPVLYKVTDDGELDVTFGTDGIFRDQLLAEQTETYQAVVQPIDGGGYNLVTTGYGRSTSVETTDIVSLRLTSDGEIDTTYGDSGTGLERIDIGGYGDNSRRLLVLPDGRIVLAGGGRLTSADVDGIVTVLDADGLPDTSFSATGWKAFDLGGPADFLWSVARSPVSNTLAFVGIKGVPTANDDAVLLILPTP
jgi:uncharacterized delta-60 repeat protein